MEILIEPVSDPFDEARMWQIRREVFEQEMGIPLDCLRLPENARAFHVLARVGPGQHPAAALSVVETTHDERLHEACGLRFPSHVRVARYAQMAVLGPYRGLHIPLRLLLEAHRRFVVPERFDYTWLMFDAQRAASSKMCRLLGFIPNESVFLSGYGRSRALVRDERTSQAKEAIRRTQDYMAQFAPHWASLETTFFAQQVLSQRSTCFQPASWNARQSSPPASRA